MAALGSPHRPLRVAIIGSGPSGFYAAEALLKTDLHVELDMFERLPTPFGLVRGGVAPDHLKIKKTARTFEKIAQHESFRFFGNVTIGRDLSVEELRQFHDAVLFACGAESDRRLNIPGEDLWGSHAATEFVGWYNGHPDYQDREFDLSQEAAVVIGQGNVAMDVSRILAKTVDELRETDITEKALDALAGSKVKEIYLVGRRGPVQAAFTPPEIKEMGALADCDAVVDPRDLVLNEASQTELDQPDHHHRTKNMAILQEFAAREPTGKSRRLNIRFHQSPVKLLGTDRVEAVVLEKNELVGPPYNQKARGTGIREELPCGLVFRSVGYRGTPIEGAPFDESRGVFPNQDGRVTDAETIIPGLYAAGWIKRGPSGVIGTNKPDSQATVGSILEDLTHLLPCPIPSTRRVRELLESRGVRFVTFEEWRRIDEAEIERGKAKGKPREKFTSVEEMLEVINKAPAATKNA